MHLVVRPELCTGCRLCELFCSFQHTGRIWPQRTRVWVVRWEREALYAPVVCQQCEQAPCVQACPTGAAARGMGIDGPCIGCRACVTACPFGAVAFDEGEGPRRCDLCGGDPWCVKVCPTGALALDVGGEDPMRWRRYRAARYILTAAGEKGASCQEVSQ